MLMSVMFSMKQDRVPLLSHNFYSPETGSIKGK